MADTPKKGLVDNLRRKFSRTNEEEAGSSTVASNSPSPPISRKTPPDRLQTPEQKSFFKARLPKLFSPASSSPKTPVTLSQSPQLSGAATNISRKTSHYIDPAVFSTLPRDVFCPLTHGGFAHDTTKWIDLKARKLSVASDTPTIKPAATPNAGASMSAGLAEIAKLPKSFNDNHRADFENLETRERPGLFGVSHDISLCFDRRRSSSAPGPILDANVVYIPVVRAFSSSVPVGAIVDTRFKSKAQGAKSAERFTRMATDLVIQPQLVNSQLARKVSPLRIARRRDPVTLDSSRIPASTEDSVDKSLDTKFIEHSSTAEGNLTKKPDGYTASSSNPSDLNPVLEWSEIRRATEERPVQHRPFSFVPSERGAASFRYLPSGGQLPASSEMPASSERVSDFGQSHDLASYGPYSPPIHRRAGDQEVEPDFPDFDFEPPLADHFDEAETRLPDLVEYQRDAVPFEESAASDFHRASGVESFPAYDPNQWPSTEQSSPESIHDVQLAPIPSEFANAGVSPLSVRDQAFLEVERAYHQAQTLACLEGSVIPPMRSEARPSEFVFNLDHAESSHFDLSRIPRSPVPRAQMAVAESSSRPIPRWRPNMEQTRDGSSADLSINDGRSSGGSSVNTRVKPPVKPKPLRLRRTPRFESHRIRAATPSIDSEIGRMDVLAELSANNPDDEGFASALTRPYALPAPPPGFDPYEMPWEDLDQVMQRDADISHGFPAGVPVVRLSGTPIGTPRIATHTAHNVEGGDDDRVPDHGSPLNASQSDWLFEDSPPSDEAAALGVSRMAVDAKPRSSSLEALQKEIIRYLPPGADPKGIISREDRDSAIQRMLATNKRHSSIVKRSMALLKEELSSDAESSRAQASIAGNGLPAIEACAAQFAGSSGADGAMPGKPGYFFAGSGPEHEPDEAELANIARNAEAAACIDRGEDYRDVHTFFAAMDPHSTNRHLIERLHALLNGTETEESQETSSIDLDGVRDMQSRGVIETELRDLEAQPSPSTPTSNSYRDLESIRRMIVQDAATHDDECIRWIGRGNVNSSPSRSGQRLQASEEKDQPAPARRIRPFPLSRFQHGDEGGAYGDKPGHTPPLKSTGVERSVPRVPPPSRMLFQGSGSEKASELRRYPTATSGGSEADWESMTGSRRAVSPFGQMVSVRGRIGLETGSSLADHSEEESSSPPKHGGLIPAQAPTTVHPRYQHTYNLRSDRQNEEIFIIPNQPSVHPSHPGLPASGQAYTHQHPEPMEPSHGHLFSSTVPVRIPGAKGPARESILAATEVKPTASLQRVVDIIKTRAKILARPKDVEEKIPVNVRSEDSTDQAPAWLVNAARSIPAKGKPLSPRWSSKDDQFTIQDDSFAHSETGYHSELSDGDGGGGMDDEGLGADESEGRAPWATKGKSAQTGGFADQAKTMSRASFFSESIYSQELDTEDPGSLAINLPTTTGNPSVASVTLERHRNDLAERGFLSPRLPPRTHQTRFYEHGLGPEGESSRIFKIRRPYEMLDPIDAASEAGSHITEWNSHFTLPAISHTRFRSSVRRHALHTTESIEMQRPILASTPQPSSPIDSDNGKSKTGLRFSRNREMSAFLRNTIPPFTPSSIPHNQSYHADLHPHIRSSSPHLWSPSRAMTVQSIARQETLSRVFLCACALCPPLWLLFAYGYMDFAMAWATDNQVLGMTPTCKRAAACLGALAMAAVFVTVLVVVVKVIAGW